MDSRAFNKSYKKLNAEQKKAVDAVEGPVMVIAGPGTGKTQILTLRIANILRVTDTAPDNILALTFTESAAFSMRKRLVDIVGSDGYRVSINTFHGFCNEIIRRYPEEFPRIIGSTPINDVDKILILKEIISSSELERLKPYGDNFFYITPIRQKISELKRENISPSKLKETAQKQREEFENAPDLYHESGPSKGKMKGKYHDLQKKIEKNEELCLVYEQYEEALQEKKFYDYEDMIIETLRAMERNSQLLLQLQEEYQYVLADEHQDVNNSQNRLLELLASYHDSPNLFIVGDEKQAIYRFQGASLDNFLFFRERFKDTLVVDLLDNYRSDQRILDASQSLIEKGESGEKGLRKPLRSRLALAESEMPFKVRTFSEPVNEYRFIVEDIRKKIEEGVEPSEIAVLYRNNKDAEEISRYFERMGVPFVIRSNQNILQDPDIQKFIKILTAVEHFGRSSYLLDVLHIDFLGLNNLDVYKLLRYCEANSRNIYEVLADKQELKRAGVRQTNKMSRLYSTLSSWKTLSKNKSFLELFEKVAYESGLISRILKDTYSVEKLEKIDSLFEDVKALVESYRDYGLSDFLEYLELLEKYNVVIKQRSGGGLSGNVQLMTAHRSKGMEFDVVYLIEAYDGHWGNKRSIEHFNIPFTSSAESALPTSAGESKNDDERRLFYVAITRARKEVNISYSMANPEGNPRLPSRFLEEIDEDRKTYEDTSRFEESVNRSPLMAPVQRTRIRAKEKQFLNELFLDQGLSVTALNNFLDCPWKYFYNNLLRVPRVPGKTMLYGTAVHSALKDFFDKLKEERFDAAGGDISKENLLKLFEYYLKLQPLTSQEYEETLEKGRRALSGYFDTYWNKWETNTLNEFKVSISFDTGLEELYRLRLRGDIDKIEFLDSGGVNVVDYKTGKPRTRNEILGNTKHSKGHYKRQLDFYQLLLDNYGDGEYQMLSGEIDFVEPDQRGNYRKERFEVTQENKEKLVEDIKAVSQRILALDFWDERCGDDKCEYCKMREMLE